MFFCDEEHFVSTLKRRCNDFFPAQWFTYLIKALHFRKTLSRKRLTEISFIEISCETNILQFFYEVTVRTGFTLVWICDFSNLDFKGLKSHVGPFGWVDTVWNQKMLNLLIWSFLVDHWYPYFSISSQSVSFEATGRS